MSRDSNQGGTAAAGGAALQEGVGCSESHDTSPVAKILWVPFLCLTEFLRTCDGACGRAAVSPFVTSGSLTQFTQQLLSNVLLGAGQRQRADERRGGRLGVCRHV